MTRGMAMGNARLQELRLISALIAAGDPSRALAQARAAAAILSRRPPPPAEQIPFPYFPAPLPAATPWTVKTSVQAARKRVASATRKESISRSREEGRKGLRGDRRSYDSPRGRVLEALLAVAECPDEDERKWRAAWERLRHACDAWLRGEPEGEKET